jgi:hypothetical protein
MPGSPKGERGLAGVGTAIMQAKMKFKDDRPFSDRDCDKIPGVVRKIDHYVRSRRRKLVLSSR